MLDVEVIPEYGLRHRQWEFLLGMPIHQVIDIVKKEEQYIKNVELFYSDKNPFGADVLLVLLNDGIKLHFDALSQRLKVIEIFKMQSIILRYLYQCFNSPSVIPSMDVIDRTFGATKSGQADAETGNLNVSFRGISFVLSRTDHVTRSTNQSLNWQVTQMIIYNGNNVADVRVPAIIPLQCFNGNIFLNQLEIFRDNKAINKLVFHLAAEDMSLIPSHANQPTNFTRVLHFGDTVQDVVSALGSPSRVYFKPDNKMRIHSAEAQRHIHTRNADYFYNYFTLGIDVLMDALRHRVKKFVLHTNIPGHYNFNSHYRCNFQIHTNSGSDEGNQADPSSRITIASSSKWSEIQSSLGDCASGDPVVLYRSGSDNSKNPFPPTNCHGYMDMIFEVIPSNDYVASVTLYQSVD